MLTLDDVTLCCVDTRHPQLALGAMQRCQQHVRFGRSLLVTKPNHQLPPDTTDIDLVEVEHIKSVQDYSQFLLRELNDLICTPYVLIVQWDGFIIEPEAWGPDFLAFDYIGAIWPQFNDEFRVGNGGFSLRSKKLLQALAQLDCTTDVAEDVFICRTARQRLEEEFKIRFAPEKLAHRFSYERTKPTEPTFGFHGLSNMPDFLSTESIEHLNHIVPIEVFGSLEARGYIKKLIRRGDLKNATTAFKKRISQKPLDLSDARIILRIITGIVWNRLKLHS